MSPETVIKDCFRLLKPPCAFFLSCKISRIFLESAELFSHLFLLWGFFPENKLFLPIQEIGDLKFLSLSIQSIDKSVLIPGRVGIA
jgi:hypothetical protein